MILDERYFKIGNFDSREFDLVFAHTDSSAYESLAGTLSPITIYNKKHRRHLAVDDDYSDGALEFETEILRASGEPISPADQVIIERALFNRRDYKKLYFQSCTPVTRMKEILRLQLSQAVMGSNVPQNHKYLFPISNMSDSQLETLDESLNAMRSNDCFLNSIKLTYSNNDGNEKWERSRTVPARILYRISLSYDENDNIDGIIYQDNAVKDVTSDIVLTYKTYYYPLVTKTVPSMGEFTSTQNVYLHCRMINPSYVETPEGVIGYRFTLLCDSPFMEQDDVTVVLSMTGMTDLNSRSDILIHAWTDEEDYIYPELTIQTEESASSSYKYDEGFTIVNESDDDTRVTKFEGDLIQANQTITVDGEWNYISDGFYEAFTGRNFVRLKDGENNIVVRGALKKIIFTFRNRFFLRTPVDDE